MTARGLSHELRPREFACCPFFIFFFFPLFFFSSFLFFFFFFFFLFSPRRGKGSLLVRGIRDPRISLGSVRNLRSGARFPRTLAAIRALVHSRMIPTRTLRARRKRSQADLCRLFVPEEKVPRRDSLRDSWSFLNEAAVARPLENIGTKLPGIRENVTRAQISRASSRGVNELRAIIHSDCIIFYFYNRRLSHTRP